MSGDDVLARASRALREQARLAPTNVSRTRQLVLLSVTQSVRRRKLALTLLPVAATFAFSTAWAFSQGQLPQVWDRMVEIFVPRGREAPAPARPRVAERAELPAGAASAAGAAVRDEDPSVPELSVDVLPQASAPSSSRSAASGHSALASHPELADRGRAEVPVAQEDPVASDREGEATKLYAIAHRAHFMDGDPAAALRAWDAYLSAAPNGSFAPEARYNRALTLVRLRRLDEAREALEPFADGGYQGYRKREARALLRALNEQP